MFTAYTSRFVCRSRVSAWARGSYTEPVDDDPDDTVPLSSTRESASLPAPAVGRRSERPVRRARTSAPAYAIRAAGTLVLLDRDVLVGRKPVAPRIATGAAPRLVTVPSPSSDVSRTHVGIRQLGSSAVVTDLRSTNGCVIHVPGSSARTLRPGESMVVIAGTRIEIGDGNVVEIHRLPIGVRHDERRAHDQHR